MSSNPCLQGRHVDVDSVTHMRRRRRERFTSKRLGVRRHAVELLVFASLFLLPLSLQFLISFHSLQDVAVSLHSCDLPWTHSSIIWAAEAAPLPSLVDPSLLAVPTATPTQAMLDYRAQFQRAQVIDDDAPDVWGSDTWLYSEIDLFFERFSEDRVTSYIALLSLASGIAESRLVPTAATVGQRGIKYGRMILFTIKISNAYQRILPPPNTTAPPETTTLGASAATPDPSATPVVATPPPTTVATAAGTGTSTGNSSGGALTGPPRPSEASVFVNAIRQQLANTQSPLSRAGLVRLRRVYPTYRSVETLQTGVSYNWVAFIVFAVVMVSFSLYVVLRQRSDTPTGSVAVAFSPTLGATAAAEKEAAMLNVDVGQELASERQRRMLLKHKARMKRAEDGSEPQPLTQEMLELDYAMHEWKMEEQRHHHSLHSQKQLRGGKEADYSVEDAIQKAYHDPSYGLGALEAAAAAEDGGGAPNKTHQQQRFTTREEAEAAAMAAVHEAEQRRRIDRLPFAQVLMHDKRFALPYSPAEKAARRSRWLKESGRVHRPNRGEQHNAAEGSGKSRRKGTGVPTSVPQAAVSASRDVDGSDSGDNRSRSRSGSGNETGSSRASNHSELGEVQPPPAAAAVTANSSAFPQQPVVDPLKIALAARAPPPAAYQYVQHSTLELFDRQKRLRAFEPTVEQGGWRKPLTNRMVEHGLGTFEINPEQDPDGHDGDAAATTAGGGGSAGGATYRLLPPEERRRIVVPRDPPLHSASEFSRWLDDDAVSEASAGDAPPSPAPQTLEEVVLSDSSADDSSPTNEHDSPNRNDKSHSARNTVIFGAPEEPDTDGEAAADDGNQGIGDQGEDEETYAPAGDEEEYENNDNDSGDDVPPPPPPRLPTTSMGPRGTFSARNATGDIETFEL